jgi:hypothetical protein
MPVSDASNGVRVNCHHRPSVTVQAESESVPIPAVRLSSQSQMLSNYLLPPQRVVPCCLILVRTHSRRVVMCLQDRAFCRAESIR